MVDADAPSREGFGSCYLGTSSFDNSGFIITAAILLTYNNFIALVVKMGNTVLAAFLDHGDGDAHVANVPNAGPLSSNLTWPDERRWIHVVARCIWPSATRIKKSFWSAVECCLQACHPIINIISDDI